VLLHVPNFDLERCLMKWERAEARPSETEECHRHDGIKPGAERSAAPGLLTASFQPR
jgi:hypothetical protein